MPGLCDKLGQGLISFMPTGHFDKVKLAGLFIFLWKLFYVNSADPDLVVHSVVFV